MTETHRVLIVDDHPLFRRGLVQLLQVIPGFQLVGEAAGGAEGLALARELRPDLILLDLNMRDVSGLDVLRGLRAARLEARVIMVTVSDSGEDVVAALRGGVDGYLLKDMEPEAMLEALQAVAAGRIVITEQLKRILEKIAEGMSNKQIGRELDIAEGTVKVHVKHILRKLDLRSRVEAAVWAVERMRG